MYKIQDFCIVRKPVLTLQDYNNMFNSNIAEIDLKKIKKIMEDNIISNAIYVASKDLYYSIYNNNEPEDKIIESFIKYYIRMSTRATPYGFFSGVSFGVNSNSDNIIKKTNRKYFYDPDYEWVNGVIKRLEGNWDILPKLKIKRNNTLLKYKDKIKNAYHYRKEGEIHYESISYKGKIIEYIYQVTKEFINFEDVYCAIVEGMNEQIQPIYIFEFMNELVKNGFLVTELSMNTKSTYRISHIIQSLDKVKTANIYKNKLISIYQRFDYMNKNNITTDYLIETESIMEKLYKTKNYFDCKLNYNTPQSVNINKYENIVELLEFLKIISSKMEDEKYLQDYKNNFLEKYGYEREVPFKELIDENKGIGYPNFDSIQLHNDNKFIQEFNRIILNGIYKNVSKGIYMYNLDNKEIKKLLETFPDKRKIYEFSNEIYTIETENCSDQDIYIAPAFFTNQIGKSIGRFDKTFISGRKKITENLQQIHNIYENMNYELINTKVNLENKRVVNIFDENNKTNRSLELGFMSTDSNVIDLNDLLVGYSPINGFYIREINSEKLLKFEHFNCLNLKITPLLYKTLIYLTKFSSPSDGLSLIMDIISVLDEKVEIRYKNIVIRQKSIELSKSDYTDCVNEYDLIKKLKEEIGKSLGEYIYLKNLDNRLLLSINNNYHMKILIKELRLKDSISLMNVEKPIELALKNNSLDTVREITLNIIDENITKGKVFKPTAEKYNANNDIYRFEYPFNKWLYLKIYCEKNMDNNLLINIIMPYLKLKKNEKIVDEYFFIKYYDPNYHIRLRIHANNSFKLVQIFEELNRKLINSGMCSNVTIETYSREIERYGGNKLISYYEAYFCQESEDILSLIEKKKMRYDEDLDFEIVNKIIILLDVFGYSRVDQLELFSTIDRNSYRGYFKKYRREILNKYNEKNVNESYMNSLLNYKNALLENRNINISRVIHSLIHMMCNRVYGPVREKEKQIISITRHTIYALNGMEKNVSN